MYKDKKFCVAFVQILVPTYKLPMFQGVADLENIYLSLFAGSDGPAVLANGGPIAGVNYVPLRNMLFKLGKLCFIWQRGIVSGLDVKQYDLVILPEGILYLSNYVVMFRCLMHQVPFGFYSHGFNYQRRSSWLSRYLEWVRKIIHRLSSVIVVYSEEGKRHLVERRHVTSDRVFVSQNTLDTRQIAYRITNMRPAEIEECRKRLKVPHEGVLLAYVGRIEQEKNPHWVLHTVQKLRQEGHVVHAVFIGTGAEEATLAEQVAFWPPELSYTVTFTGNIPVDQVDLYLASADICVMPGMTGLAVVHAFAAGKPYVTIKSPYHSPEIVYLQHGENGLIAGPSVDEFFAEVLKLVRNPQLRQRLGASGLSKALNELSMDNQVSGFRKAFDYINNKHNAKFNRRNENSTSQ